MGAAVGSIVQTTAEYRANGQLCMTTLNWRVITPSALNVGGPEETAFGEALAFDPGGSFFQDQRALSSTAVMFERIRVQIIRPDRLFPTDVQWNNAGLVAGEFKTQNVHLGVTMKALRAVRAGRATLKIGGQSTDSMDGGTWKAAHLALWDVAAEALKAVFTVAIGGGQYRPVILHPLGSAVLHDDVFNTEVSNIIKTNERRTVGRGI